MRAFEVAMLICIVSSSISADAEPLKESLNAEPTSQLMYYPGKTDSIKDSAVLSAYLRIIAIANDELALRGVVKRSDNQLIARGDFVTAQIELATKSLVKPLHLSTLAKLLHDREIEDGGPAEYERAMQVMENAMSICLTKLVLMHTTDSDLEFMKFKASLPRIDGRFALMMDSLDVKRIGRKKSAY